MPSSEQDAVGDLLGGLTPKDGVVLVGWSVMAEWEEPNGERLLTRLVSEGSSPWQVKGYLWDGLNVKWPPPSEQEGDQPTHHNPGHPDGWVRLD